MTKPTHLLCLFSISITLPCGNSQAPSCHDLSAVATIARQATTIAPGLAVQVSQHGQRVYRRAFGNSTVYEIVPLYSATKPLSAAVLLALADRGQLDLDDRVGQYLHEFDRAPRRGITLRMCFSHTSGLPNTSPWIFDTSTTLRTAARNIASLPLDFAPGTKFAYGNVAMHVAGAVCEVVSGKAWSQLFLELIAQPLGFRNTDYTANGTTRNPRIAGGARSNLRDYERFLEMLRLGGQFAGVRVLSRAAVTTMLSDHTSHLPIHFTPNPHNAPYGLGVWVDQRDSLRRTTHVSSPGFGGFTGWINLARGVSGIVLANSNGRALFPYFERTVAAVDAALLPIGATCLGLPTPACATPARQNLSTWPRTGQPSMEMVVHGAPVTGRGVLLLSHSANANPVPVLDVSLWPRLPALVALDLTADSMGRASVSASLKGVPAGETFALQSLWLDPRRCGPYQLRASDALSMIIQP